MPDGYASRLLVATIALATMLACGPGEGTQGRAVSPPSPAPPSSSAAENAPPPATTSPSPVPAATTAPVPAPPPVVMKPPVPSAMEGKLREIGLDPAALPPLNKLDPKTLRDVMNTFTKALGVQCSYCHEKDFRAPTAKKKIATHMWNDFTRLLAVDGGTLYCDSCHGGRTQLLDRRDLNVLGAWMQESYVDKLKRSDRKEHS